MHLQKRAMMTGIGFAVLVRTKGLGCALWDSQYGVMASSSWCVLRKTPRRNGFISQITRRGEKIR